MPALCDSAIGTSAVVLLVYSPHEYPASIYPQVWFSDPNYPDDLLPIWDRYWGFQAADVPILIGEFVTGLDTERDRQRFQEFTSYIKSKHLHWTFWSLNPNSGDTGGLLLDNWVSVHQEKQELLETIQYPLIGSGSPPVVKTPVPGRIAPVTGTPSRPQLTMYIDNFASGSIQSWHVFQSGNSRIAPPPSLPGSPALMP